MQSNNLYIAGLALALGAAAVPAHAGEILYAGNSLCYVSGCSEIVTVGSGGAVTPFATNITTFGLAADNQGNVYASSRNSGEIVEYAPDATSTVVGGFTASHNMAFDSSGNLYTTDYSAGTVREYAPAQYDPNNPVSNLTDVCCGNLDGGNVNYFGAAFNSAGDLFITDNNSSAIYELTPTGNALSGSPLIGYSTPTLFVGNGLNSFWLQGPRGIAVDAEGNFFVAENGASDILKISADGQTITTFASAASTAGLATPLSHPSGLAFDSSGNLFVTNNSYSNTSQILEFTPNGVGSVYASSGLHQTQSLVFATTGADSSAPEPGTWLLMLTSGAALLAVRRRSHAR